MSAQALGEPCGEMERRKAKPPGPKVRVYVQEKDTASSTVFTGLLPAAPLPPCPSGSASSWLGKRAQLPQAERPSLTRC